MSTNKMEDLLINELAKRCAVSPRTIRYYTQEGLLPEPIIKGKFAYYDHRHIQRLKLILQLKNTYLPLKEIRQLLISLSDQEIQNMLDANLKKSAINKPPQSILAEQKSESALEYIASLLQTHSEVRTETLSPNLPTQISQNRQTRISGAVTETLQRIILAPGVELLVKEPLELTDRACLEDLIYYAKKIFSK